MSLWTFWRILLFFGCLETIYQTTWMKKKLKMKVYINQPSSCMLYMTKVDYPKNDLGCMHELQFASTFGQIFIQNGTSYGLHKAKSSLIS